MPLPLDFYTQSNVINIAKSLIGKVLITKKDGIITSGIIIETEAYNGINDRASHAFGGKITARNEAMYMNGGIAYVYLCYGIHHLFNVVTNVEGIPDAVLIRAIYPL
ncbi:MAG TPA: DNA-3-methyladenine glycosylase, partial [Bacteroidales bacterium]|nr:DNA-3-methyladenine glycosylase [Bacteroidales bacterium]